MAEELQLDSLKEIKKADYVKAFKNKAVWKKAKAVIFLVDYKLEGKKTTIAIPFKKEAEMKSEMKRLKKEKLHLMKKSGGGLISFENEGEDGMKAKVELLFGGLKPELLQAKGNDLFWRINTTLEVLIAAGAELEAPDPNEPVEAEDPNEEEEGDDAAHEIDELINMNKDRRVVVYSKVEEGIFKIESAKDKVPIDKLKLGLQKIEEGLQKLIAEVKADGVVDANEQKRIDELTLKINSLKIDIQKTDGAEISGTNKLTDEQKAKIKANKEKMNAKMNEILSLLDVELF